MEFTYVTTQEQLEKESRTWKSAKILGIDTEGENNFHHYGSFLTIMQISDDTKDWIVDILLLKANKANFKPLVEVLENPGIIKVFHDVSFDLRIIKSEFGCKTMGIFDSYLALMLLGEKNNNLGNVLEKYFSAVKEKKYQKADWTIRPIKDDMLAYAVGDSKYLIRLKKILEDKLSEKGRLEWAREEFRKLEESDYSTPGPDFMDLKGAHDLTDSQRGILKRLFFLREKYAERADRPVHFIIPSQRLIELAMNPPRTVRDWEMMRGVHPAVKRNARMFFDAVSKGKNEPVLLPEVSKKKMSKRQKDMFEHLCEVRDKIAISHDMEKQMILTKDEIKQIVIDWNLSSVLPWKRELLKKEGVNL